MKVKEKLRKLYKILLNQLKIKRDASYPDLYSSTRYQVISISVVIISQKLSKDFTCKDTDLISLIKSTI